MNVANLQIEGLLMAMAHVNRALVRSGALSVDDIDTALHRAEATMTADERLSEDMSPSNRDAVCFPIRLLREANRSQGDAELQSFSRLAETVGRTKRPYNDQL